jgi:hypothetical protein
MHPFCATPLPAPDDLWCLASLTQFLYHIQVTIEQKAAQNRSRIQTTSSSGAQLKTTSGYDTKYMGSVDSKLLCGIGSKPRQRLSAYHRRNFFKQGGIYPSPTLFRAGEAGEPYSPGQ